MSVIDCGLIKLLSQFGGDLRVPKGAQGLNHHFVPILADHYCRFSDIAHLSCGKTNTCQKQQKVHLVIHYAAGHTLQPFIYFFSVFKMNIFEK